MRRRPRWGWTWLIVAALCGLGGIAEAGRQRGDNHIGPGGSDTTTRAQRVQALTDQVRGLLDQLENAAPGDVAGIQQQALPVVHDRKMQFGPLIEEDPAGALAAALDADAVERLGTALPDAKPDIETPGRFEGRAEVAVSDDFEHGKSVTIVTIDQGDRPVRVHFAGPLPDGLESGTFLSVEGVLSGDRIAASSGQVMMGVEAAPACSTTGDQKVIAILVNFPNHTLPPSITPDFVRGFMFGTGGGTSLDGFWREASYGLTSASGAVVGPYNLTQDYDCNTTGPMRYAALLAADADVDFTQYNRIFIIFPPLASCYFAGLGELSCNQLSTPGDGTFSASTSWLYSDNLVNNVAPHDFGVYVASHEGGHNLGLQHANLRSFGNEALGYPGAPYTDYEYGDVFSSMGRPIFGHYAAPHKVRLGWLDPARVQTVTTSGTYHLDPWEYPSTGTQALKVQRGSENEWLWIESRTPSVYDCVDHPAILPLQCDGALVHYDVNSLWSFVLDFNPNTFSVYDAPIASGTTWTDPYTGLSLAPAHGAGTLDVTATYGARTCHKPPTVTLTPAGQSVANGAPVSFSVTITNTDAATCPNAVYNLGASPAGWNGRFTPSTITLPPGQSGSSTLALTVPQSTEAGPATVTATATWTTVSGSGTQTVNVISNCVLGDPIVQLSPDSQNVAVNEQATYNLTIDSTDSAGCGGHRFDLTSALPAGWSGSISPAFITLAGNGPIGYATLLKNIPAGTAIGSTFTVDATATSRPGTPPATPHAGNDTALLTVAGPCTHNPPGLSTVPSAQIAAPGADASFDATIRNNDSPTCHAANFTILVTGPPGWTVFPVSDCIPACPPVVVLAPGQSEVVSFGGTVPFGAAPGVYDINMTVDGPNNAGISVKVGVGPVCIAQNPSVTLAPASVATNAGQTASLTANVQNNDLGSACAPSTYALAATVPASWSSSLASSVGVPPGASAAVPFGVTPNIAAASGPYNVSVSAANGFYGGTGSATVQVSAGHPPRTLEAGYAHSISEHSDGTVWAWGLNATGQLGDGTLTSRNAPVRAGSLASAVEVGAGVFHSVALLGDGTVSAWGGNSDGQLGDGTTTPRSVPGPVPGLSGIVAIAAGFSHTLALKNDGTVWTWGDNWGGQIGDGTTTDRLTPFQVPGLSGVASVAAGAYHSVALKSDGTVWTWGRNAEGELGDGTHADHFAPAPVPGLGGVTRVSCGAYFNMVVLSDGTMKGWGHNFFGQIGDGSTDERTTPVTVSVLSGVSKVAAGSAFTLVLRADGTVWAVGQNVFGELGDGTLTNRSVPQQVAGLSNIVDIAAGEDHSLARSAAGIVYGWGKNLNGQVGGGPNPQTTPVFIVDETQPAPLGLVAPVGGETWAPGSSQVVSWTGAGPISVGISLDAGTTYTTLVGSSSLQDVPIVVPASWTTARGRVRIDRVGSPPSFAQTGAYIRIQAPQQHPWLAMTVDASPAVVGEFASIAIDPSGRTGIAYTDRTNGDLKFALRVAGGWSIETVDTLNATGWYTSLAFGADGSPRIAYMDGTRTYLRYARKTGSAWTTEDVADTNCTLPTSLGFDQSDRPFIAIQDCASTRVLVYAKSGTWSLVRSTSGAAPSLRMSGNLPRLSYFLHSTTPTQLHYLSAAGSFGSFTWTDETVPGGGGANASALAIDAQGNPRISFYAADTKSLRMAKKIAGAWSVEIVDAGAGDVGNWNSIALDPAGRPRISYLANGLVKIAEWNGTSWVPDAVDASGDTPAATALAVDPAGNDRVAYFDTPGGDLRYAISQPDVTAPSAPVLSLDSGRTTVVVTWTATGDDGTTGTAAKYDLRRSASPIDESNFSQAGSVPTGPPDVPGSGVCVDLFSLPGCAPQYFALRVLDDLGNSSPLATGQIATKCSGSQEIACF